MNAAQQTLTTFRHISQFVRRQPIVIPAIPELRWQEVDGLTPEMMGRHETLLVDGLVWLAKQERVVSRWTAGITAVAMLSAVAEIAAGLWVPATLKLVGLLGVATVTQGRYETDRAYDTKPSSELNAAGRALFDSFPVLHARWGDVICCLGFYVVVCWAQVAATVGGRFL